MAATRLRVGSRRDSCRQWYRRDGSGAADAAHSVGSSSGRGVRNGASHALRCNPCLGRRPWRSASGATAAAGAAAAVAAAGAASKVGLANQHGLVSQHGEPLDQCGSSVTGGRRAQGVRDGGRSRDGRQRRGSPQGVRWDGRTREWNMTDACVAESGAEIGESSCCGAEQGGTRRLPARATMGDAISARCSATWLDSGIGRVRCPGGGQGLRDRWPGRVNAAR